MLSQETRWRSIRGRREASFLWPYHAHHRKKEAGGWGWGKGLKRQAGEGSGEKILQIHKAFWKLLGWNTSTPPPSPPLRSQAALSVVNMEISRHLKHWGQNLVNLHEYISQPGSINPCHSRVFNICPLCTPTQHSHRELLESKPILFFIYYSFIQGTITCDNWWQVIPVVDLNRAKPKADLGFWNVLPPPSQDKPVQSTHSSSCLGSCPLGRCLRALWTRELLIP